MKNLLKLASHSLPLSLCVVVEVLLLLGLHLHDGVHEVLVRHNLRLPPQRDHARLHADRLKDHRLGYILLTLQGGAGGLTHGLVDFDLDVPPFCPATQAIQPFSHLPKQS